MLNKFLISDNNSLNTFSKEVSEVYERYKSKIEQIIYNNYSLDKNEELLSLFKDLGIVLSERNNELLRFLEKEYSLDFKKDFDFTGGLKISKDLVNNSDEPIKSFFSNGYTREEGNNIHSRGYGYYFNFSGLSMDGNNFKLNTGKYLSGLSKYYNDAISYLGQFNGKDISSLNENERKLLQVGLEHYKNILLFLQNFIISISDKEYLSKHVLNSSPTMFKKYFVDLSSDENFQGINDWIKSELEYVIHDFSDITLGFVGNSDNILNYDLNENIATIFGTMSNLYEGSFEKQKNHIDKLKNNKSSGKQTDINGLEKSISRLNNKFISNLLRIIREEDNPIKELFSCHNILQNIPKDIKNIDINGLLYGGIEMPYFMKYILNRFSTIDDININLLGLSKYSNRNLKQTSVLGNYSFINGNNKGVNGARLQLVLDDNSYDGNSLQVASNILSSKGPIYPGVAEVGLRRGNIGKLKEGSNINYLLSKVVDSASVTPIERNRGDYRNMVTKYILKKLPGLVGSL